MFFGVTKLLPLIIDFDLVILVDLQLVEPNFKFFVFCGNVGVISSIGDTPGDDISFKLLGVKERRDGAFILFGNFIVNGDKNLDVCVILDFISDSRRCGNGDNGEFGVWIDLYIFLFIKLKNIQLILFIL